ncbi:chromosome partition protein [Klebsiella phage P61_2]|nr:chromosome partition protein [Klebsiella phage P61_2]
MEIKGYKGGSSNVHTPVEDPDSLVSNATVRMLLALAEGETVPISAEDLPKRVHLDGTPVQNEDGSVNIPGVTLEYRNGTPQQEPINGFPAVESETRINVELKKASPWVRNVSNTEIDAVRIRMNFRLVIQQKDGDRVGGRIDYKIEYRKIGDSAYTEAFNGAVDGKQKDNYERDHRIDLPKSSTGWQIRVTRLTDDSTSDTTILNSGIVAITEIVDARVRYPWTSLLFVSFDAKSFQNIPKISIKMRGRMVMVPSNYDPETHTYNGTWNGTFKQAWTDNPAWIVYDIILHKRFGIGRRIPASFLNKWTMYAISQRCDELVTNADGTQDRRYTCNVYIQKRAHAWSVIRDLASIFNGMVSYSNMQLQFAQDAPAEVRHVVTNDDVVNGTFEYTYGSMSNRRGIAMVTFDDPKAHYKTQTTVAQFKDLVERYGVEPLEVSGIGCTNEYEAQRRGLWALLSNINDMQISYRVGLNGIKYLIGDVVGIANRYVQGGQFGGRVLSVTGTTITADRAISDHVAVGDRVIVRQAGSDGTYNRAITEIAEDRQSFTVEGTDLDIQAGEIFLLDTAELAPELIRITKITYNEQDNNFTVTGLQYSHSKYLQVDTGARIEDRPTSLIPTGQVSAPTNVVAEGYSIVNQGLRSANVNCSWAGVDQAISYDIQVRRTSQSNGQWSQGWTNLASQSSTSVDLTNVLTGTYQFRVRAVSRDGGSSPWAESNQVFVDGKRGSIPAVAGLNGVGIVNGITWRWMTGTDDLVDMKSTELQFRRVDDNGSPVGDWIDLSVVTYPTGTFTQNGLGFAERVQVRARFVSSYSDAGPWNSPVMAMTSDNMDDYYQNIDDAIKGSDTYGELTDGIKEVSDSAQAAKDAAQAAQVTADGAVATNQQQQQQINNQAAEIAQNAKDITAAANAGSDNAKAIAQEILDRQAGDLETANKAASDVADAIAKAETDDAEVAAQAAANLLATKNEVEAQISTTNTTMQDGFDSLAQQIASISAGTGEQFDSIKIWYFDKNAEGWASDDSNTNLLPVDSDGWIYPAGASSTMRSPNPLAIDGQSYKYIRLRMKRVGNPAWAGRLYWIGVNEQGWNTDRSVSIPAPDFDPATGISVISIPDLLWANSGTIRRLRLDFSNNQSADNYFAVDWLAVGRPTPGASQAQIQDLKTAMTAADSAEAAARNTLAVQLRGNYEGTDPAKLVTGIIYNERQTRVTAEQAISSDVNTLRTDYNANKAAVTQRLDTLTSENQSQAQALTQLQSGLTDANGKIGANTTAINQLKTDVSDIDGRVTANSSLITGLESTINNDAIALVANPNNLLTNTGFERDKAAWTGFNSYSDIYAAQVPHSGAKILRGKAGGTTAISQVVASLKKGRTYRFGGYVKRSGDLVIGNVGNNKFRIGNADTGAGPLSELPFSQNNVGTNWTLLTKDYVPASDQNITFGINFLINTGELYFDDVFFVDVTDEINNAANASAISGLTTRVTAAEGKISTNSQSITQLKGDVSTLQGQIANKADASALQQLQTTVSQQGDKLASQGSAITELQNTAQNGKAKYWLTKIFDIKVNTGYVPKLTDLAGAPPLAVSEMSDAAKLDFQSYGDYKIAYAKSLVYLNADKTIEISPGSRIVDDTGRLYVNGVETASFGASTTKYSLALKKGWNTIEFVVAQMTGGFYINFGLKLSDNVDQLFSGAGQMAAASAAQVISSQVEQTAGKVDANSSAILTLNNSVKDINTALNNKADASALQSLTTRVSTAEGKITSQGNAITQLTNDLSTANGKITANTGAISSLTSRVTAAEGKIDSQAESITSINSSIKGILTQAANLIPNPTVDPAYPQMGMTVVSTTSEGVPAGCPYAWAIKCQYRDHVPVMNNIPCHEGQVFEISVLAACGTGTAPFQHYIGTSTQAAGSIGSPQANGGQISAATGAQWTRTTWRFKPNATHAAKGYFRPFLQINQTGPDFGTVWYATDWQVRDVTAAANAEGKADANATAISQLTTRVTNAEGQITSQGQAITKLTSDLSTLTGVVNSKADASALNALTTRVSSAEGKIASQGQSITQLTNSISNAESAMDAQGKIPGNLLANASFERDQAAFTGWNALSTVVTLLKPHSGSKSLRMASGGTAGVGQEVEVTQGRRYRFGVFAKQDSGTEIQDPANTKFRIADSSGLLAGVNYGPFTGDWQHVFMDWTAPKNTTASFQLTTALKSGVMYFDDVYVVDITNETNIKGNADAITSLNTKVTQQGNDITSQSNAITNLSNSLKTQQYSNSNPWVDGSFESYADGQAISGANAVVTTDYAFSGSKSLKCRRADGETGNSDKMFGYETAIRENAVYRYECWAMMPEDETPPDGWGCNVGMIVRTAAGTAAWPTAFAINEAALTAGGGRGKWVKFSGKLSAGGSQKTRGRLWISTRGTSGGPGYRLYIDDLVITDVTDAHAAQTTADANSSAISGLTSRVSTAEGKITAQADSITKLTGEINTINGTLSQKADASAVNALQSRVTTAEGKIDSHGTAITQLTNWLEAYRRTGENLVQNFDFLQGDTAYNVQNASKVTFGDYGDGKVGVRMVRTDGNSPGIFANNKKPIPQNGQRRYRYVVRAKGVSGAMNLLMRRWNYNGSVEGSYSDKNNTLTTSWQTLTWETDLNQASGVDGAAFGLYCHPSNAEIWIDSFKVYDITEEVTIKANSDALNTLTSTVTQNGKDIAAQANALTQLKSSLTNDAVALAANPDNMLTNTGFERGTDNWTGFNSLADVYAAQAPKSGAYILRGKAGGNASISQNILNVKKGQTYRFGGYAKRTADMAIGPNTVGNNKFRLGNADTGAGPLSELNFSQSNIGTNWTLLTKDYVPSSDMTILFSINWNLSAGEVYFDDVFFVDVTDEINNAANATAINNLTTRVTSAEGKITSQGTAITQLTSDLSTANGKITANANAITSLQSTVTQQGNTLTTQGQAITKLNSDLSDLSGVVDTKASASAVSQLTTRVTNAEGKITANSTALNSITSRVDDAESAIDGLNETTAANGLAMANGFQQLRAQIGDNQAAITQTNKAVVDLESATAQQIDTINASMDGMSATVQQTSTAVADINGKLSAQWGVKVQTDTGGGNPRIAGIQLGIDASGSSQFLVMADTFAVYTGGASKTYPFVVQNGVAYMQEALIRDGSITNAKIGNEIKSNNFVDGSQGWRIGKDGSSQFNNVVVRGAVYATDGWFNGTVYANRIEGDIGSFAINIAQHRTRKVPKATWQWFELARFRRQNFDQVINIRGGLLQTDSITIDGGARLRAGMSYAPGADGGLNPGYLSYAMLLRGTGATSGGGSMEIGVELAYETGGATRLRTAQEEMNIDNMSFVVPAGTGDAILRYGCYLDRNGQMVLTILSRFDAFAARNNNVIRGSSTP